MELFDIKYETKTPKGEMNFIGAVRKYFDIYTKNVLSQTKEEYIRRYNESIFPFVNPSRPASSYNDDQISELLDLIRENSHYSLESVKTNLEHLVFDPIECYFNDPNNIVDHEALWGSEYKFKRSAQAKEDIDSAILVLKKSLTFKEEKIVDAYLFDPETEIGENIGLALMFFMGVRNNEACGLEWRHIKEMKDHPDCYYMQVYQTTQLSSNKLKLGGKTYNAPRQLPIVNRLKVLLDQRKQFLKSKITVFPYTDEKGNVFHSIDELPIACKGTNYTRRCNSYDLSYAGRTILREKIKLKENEVSGLSYIIRSESNTEYDLGEKDPTTYLLRRNLATHLYTLGFTTADSQYYMGHALDNTPLNRVDFQDEEYLYSLWLKLQNHPFNHEYLDNFENSINSKTKINLEKDKAYSIQIEGKEVKDPIVLKTNNSISNITIVENHIAANFDSEVDIIKQIHDACKKM